MVVSEKLAVPGDTNLCARTAALGRQLLRLAVPGDTDLCARTAASEAAVPGDTDLSRGAEKSVQRNREKCADRNRSRFAGQPWPFLATQIFVHERPLLLAAVPGDTDL